MNSLGKYVLTKTQKIVLLVVVFALIAGGYYAGFYLPVQRRIRLITLFRCFMRWSKDRTAV